MNKKDLKKLSKSQLIKLLIKQGKNIHDLNCTSKELKNPIVSQPKQEKLLTCKSVNNYEDLVIKPPEQFRDRQRPPKPTRKPPPPSSPKPKQEQDEKIFKFR